MNEPNVFIVEPLTYTEREVALAFIKCGYVVEILPVKSYSDQVRSLKPILYMPMDEEEE